jgi:hypothetical protein
MSTLRTIAIILLVVGLLGFIIPGIPGAALIKWAIILAVIIFIVDLVSGRKAV